MDIKDLSIFISMTKNASKINLSHFTTDANFYILVSSNKQSQRSKASEKKI